MASSALFLVVLGAALSVSSGADVVARVPSNFYLGTKWVLFRDENVPNPPPNVIQHENSVQVLPTYQYPQQQHQLAGSFPVHVTPTPVPVIAPAVVGDYESEVVEAKSQQHGIHGFQHLSVIHHPVLTSYSVPHEAVHVQGPAYFDLLRKKKSSN